jgi:hypothetical protein
LPCESTWSSAPSFDQYSFSELTSKMPGQVLLGMQRADRPSVFPVTGSFAYHALASGISWGGLLMLIVAGGSDIPATPDRLARLIAPLIPFDLLVPSIAGLNMTGLADGKAGVSR